MGLQSPSSMLLLLLLLTPARANTQGTCPSPHPCQLNCTGCSLYDKFPDPLDCHGYYVCDGIGNPYPLHLVCPDGEVFDVNIHDCFLGGSCNSSSQVCIYQCSADRLSAAHPLACDYYYECNGEHDPQLKQCQGPDLFFDGESCQTDETRCRHCLPYCYEADINTAIPDPRDCRKYYFCDHLGVTNTHGRCKSGENFDRDWGICSPFAECTTQPACRNVLGPDGCIDTFSCLGLGFFAKCPNRCTPDFYYCREANGEYQDVHSCSSGEVFSPDGHICVPEDQCPYPQRKG